MTALKELGGFIRLYRSLLSWEWHDDPNTLSLFIHLLLMANFREGRWHEQEIQRGQVLTGRKKLAELTGLSEQQVRTALNRLKTTSTITIKSTNKFSLITIVNYEGFQDLQGQANQQESQQTPIEQPQRKEEIFNKRHTMPFTPPSVDEIANYGAQIGKEAEAQGFFDYYSALGWRIAGQPMADWKAAFRRWRNLDGVKKQKMEVGRGFNDEQRAAAARSLIKFG